MIPRLLLVPTLFLGLSTAQAQDCTELAAQITRESVRSSARAQSDIVLKSSLCIKEIDKANSSEESQISGAFKALSANGSNSKSEIRDKQKDMCDNKFGSYWSDQSGSTEIKTQSVYALDVISQCLNVETFRPVSIIFQDRAVNVDYRNGTQGNVTINSLSVVPSDAASCSVRAEGKKANEGDDLGMPVQPNRTASVTCERLPETDDVSPSEAAYPGGLVTIHTDHGSRSIRLFRRPSVKELGAEASAEAERKRLLSNISARQTEINTLYSEISKLKSTRPNKAFIVYEGDGAISLPISNIVRYMNVERPGSCVGNWGDYTNEYFSSLCSGMRFNHTILGQWSGGACGHTTMLLECFEQ